MLTFVRSKDKSMLPQIEIGKWNELEVIKSTDQGLYVGDDVEEVLLPNKYVSPEMEIGSKVRVFVYMDSEDRIVATTLVPKVERDQFAFLNVKDVAGPGAFLDWGLEKDLLSPYKEQREKMQAGQSYLIYMYLDDLTDRLVASSQLGRFTIKEVTGLEVGDQVDLLIGPTEGAAYRVIVNDKHLGLVYQNEIFDNNVEPGMRAIGYVKQIREDGKLDLTLRPPGYRANIDGDSQRVLDALTKADGKLGLHDKSDPELIKRKLGLSKRSFKVAIGNLYRRGMIKITDKGIFLKKK